MKEFEKIYEENIPHNSFLDKESVIKCMTDSYNSSVMDLLEWLSKQGHLNDNKEQILKEYTNYLKCYYETKSNK